MSFVSKHSKRHFERLVCRGKFIKETKKNYLNNVQWWFSRQKMAENDAFVWISYVEKLKENDSVYLVS